MLAYFVSKHVYFYFLLQFITVLFFSNYPIIFFNFFKIHLLIDRLTIRQRAYNTSNELL